MDFLIQKVYNTVISKNMISSGEHILIGLSGGADSVFLLKALDEIRKALGFEIACAHLNHGIRGDEAFRDEEFCQKLCKEMGIRFFSVKKDIPRLAKERKISEETCGREERYRFFRQLCSEFDFDKIAVAHNMNDSTETVILNMIRGASLNGLCGIDCVNGMIIRPIINVSRDEIEHFMHKNNLPYCIDSTNLTVEYTRNKIRHIILEEMKGINPAVINTIHANAGNLREDNDFIESYADSLNCITAQDNRVYVCRTVFDAQHTAIKKRILIKAFTKLTGNAANIGHDHLEILLGAIHSGKKYNMPNGITVCISFDKIIFSDKPGESHEEQCDFLVETSIVFNNKIIVNSCFTDKILPDDANTLYLDYGMLEKRRLTLRSRKNGDKFIPLGMKHSKKIKQFLIEMKIPFDMRNDVPILCDGDEIVAVIPYRIADKYKVTEKTEKILKITQEI